MWCYLHNSISFTHGMVFSQNFSNIGLKNSPTSRALYNYMLCLYWTYIYPHISKNASPMARRDSENGPHAEFPSPPNLRIKTKRNLYLILYIFTV